MAEDRTLVPRKFYKGSKAAIKKIKKVGRLKGA